MLPRGLEPRTFRLLAERSNQLSYESCASISQYAGPAGMGPHDIWQPSYFACCTEVHASSQIVVRLLGHQLQEMLRNLGIDFRRGNRIRACMVQALPPGRGCRETWERVPGIPGVVPGILGEGAGNPGRGAGNPGRGCRESRERVPGTPEGLHGTLGFHETQRRYGVKHGFQSSTDLHLGSWCSGITPA